MHEKQGYFDFYVVVEAYIKILICFLSILYAYSGILITLSPYSYFSLQFLITLLTLSLLSHFRRVMSFSFFSVTCLVQPAPSILTWIGIIHQSLEGSTASIQVTAIVSFLLQSISSNQVVSLGWSPLSPSSVYS